MKIAALIALTVMTASAAYVLEWSAPANYSSATAYTSNKTTSYDVNGDSIPDVFLSDSSALKVYSGVTHSLIWTVTSGGYTYIGYPYIANTDGDAAKEMVFQVYTYNSGYTGKFYIYDCGTHALEYTSPVKNGYPYVTVADVDSDNTSEIIITSGNAGSRILEVYGSNDAGVDEGGASAPPENGAPAYPNPSTRNVTIALPADVELHRRRARAGPDRNLLLPLRQPHRQTPSHPLARFGFRHVILRPQAEGSPRSDSSVRRFLPFASTGASVRAPLRMSGPLVV